MADEDIFEVRFDILEDQGWWCPYMTHFIFCAGKSFERQKQALRNDLPLQIYLSLSHAERLQNIKDAMNIYPELKPEMATIMKGVTNQWMFENLSKEKSQKLKHVIKELNKLLSNKE